MKSVLWVGHRLRNRRAERPVIERVIEFGETDDLRFGAQWQAYQDSILSILREGELLAIDESFPAGDPPNDPRLRFSNLYVQLSLLLQQACGHRVSWCKTSPHPERNQVRCLVEYEHGDVGMTCDKLAWSFLAEGRQGGDRR